MPEFDPKQQAWEDGKADHNPDSHVFRCEACGWTCATGAGAVQHELSTHGGAQTCWRTIDRDALAALDQRGEL